MEKLYLEMEIFYVNKEAFPDLKIQSFCVTEIIMKKEGIQLLNQKDKVGALFTSKENKFEILLYNSGYDKWVVVDRYIAGIDKNALLEPLKWQVREDLHKEIKSRQEEIAKCWQKIQLLNNLK
jgi:hypothetical protein